MEILKEFAATPAGLTALVLAALAAGVVIGVYLKIRADVHAAEGRNRVIQEYEERQRELAREELSRVRLIRAGHPAGTNRPPLYDWAGEA